MTTVVQTVRTGQREYNIWPEQNWYKYFSFAFSRDNSCTSNWEKIDSSWSKSIHSYLFVE